jgi:hypothetical protein
MNNYDSQSLSPKPTIFWILRCKFSVFRMIGIRSTHKSWLEFLKRREHLQDIGIYWKVILKWILHKECDKPVLIYRIIKFWGLQVAENF